MIRSRSQMLVPVFLCVPCCVLGQDLATTPHLLPQGRKGIASRYPGDRQIEKDRAVVFVEPFNTTDISEMKARWGEVKGATRLSLSSEAPGGSADGRSLQVRFAADNSDDTRLFKPLPDGYNELYARFYIKIDPASPPLQGLGLRIGATPRAESHPELPAPGNRGIDLPFWTSVQPRGRSWQWDFATYWQGLRSLSEPINRPVPFLVGGKRPAVARGKWTCVELMLKVNTPASEPNGAHAFWINGKLYRRDGQTVSSASKGHPQGKWTPHGWQPDPKETTAFAGFNWRNSGLVAINALWLDLPLQLPGADQSSRVWVDHLVVARQYIGPFLPARKAVKTTSTSKGRLIRSDAPVKKAGGFTPMNRGFAATGVVMKPSAGGVEVSGTLINGSFSDYNKAEFSIAVKDDAGKILGAKTFEMTNFLQKSSEPFRVVVNADAARARTCSLLLSAGY